MKRIFLLLFSILPFSLMAISLDEYYLQILEHNPNFQNQKHELQAKMLNYKISLANFFFSLSANANFLHYHNEIKFSDTVDVPLPSNLDGTITKKNQYSAELKVTQPIFTGGKILAYFKQAGKQKEIQKIEITLWENKLYTYACNSYFGLLTAKNFKSTAQNNVKLLKKHLEEVKVLRKNGWAIKTDVLRTKVALLTAQKTYAESESQYLNAINIFNELRNSMDNKNISLSTPYLNFKVTMPLKEMERLLVQNNLELKILEQQKKVIYWEKVKKRSAFLPSIAFYASYNWHKGDQTDLEGGEHWYAGIQGSINLWNWGKDRWEYEKVNVQYQELLNTIVSKRNELLKKLRKFYTDLDVYYQDILRWQEGIKESKLNYENMEESYKQGVARNLDVLDAYQTYLEAQTNYFYACYNYSLTLTQIKELLNIKWEEFVQK